MSKSSVPIRIQKFSFVALYKVLACAALPALRKSWRAQHFLHLARLVGREIGGVHSTSGISALRKSWRAQRFLHLARLFYREGWRAQHFLGSRLCRIRGVRNIFCTWMVRAIEKTLAFAALPGSLLSRLFGTRAPERGQEMVDCLRLSNGLSAAVPDNRNCQASFSRNMARHIHRLKKQSAGPSQREPEGGSEPATNGIKVWEAGPG